MTLQRAFCISRAKSTKEPRIRENSRRPDDRLYRSTPGAVVRFAVNATTAVVELATRRRLATPLARATLSPGETGPHTPRKHGVSMMRRPDGFTATTRLKRPPAAA